MRRFVAVMAVLGCQRHAVPPAPAPEPPPPCIPKLESEITQLKDVTEPLPDAVPPNAALDAAVEFLETSGQTIEAVDRGAHTAVTTRFPGQTIQWTCDMKEYRSYAYRVAITGNQLSVGLDCWRTYGWEERIVNGRVVPADRGGETECLENARYTSRLDATLTRNILAGTLELLQRRPAR